MTPEQLKASILQYAIMGKLVEQKAEEGTAEELYEQIQDEKEKLIKEGKIKKEKPLVEITEDETPFDIPESWKWVRLGQCGCFERGSGIKKDEVTPEGFPCVRYGQLYTTYKTRFSQAVSHIPKEVFDKCHKVYKNDILMALTGENEYDIALAVTYEGEEELAMGGDMTRFFGHCMNPIYLTYVINSRYGILCKSKMASGNIIVHISNDKLATIPIPLPPLEEQHRIVKKIEELLPFVDRYAEAYEKLEKFNAKFPEDMKKSILQYAIQGKLVEQRAEEGSAEELYKQIQEEKQKLIREGKIKKEKPLAEITEAEIPFDIPESWKWVRLGEIITFQGGYAFKSDSYITKSNNQVIRLGNVKTNKLLIHEKEVFISDELAEQASDYKILENDILVSMTGTRRKKDYFFTVLISESDFLERALYLNQRVGCFRAVEGIFHKYLLYVLQADVIKDIIFLKETGTANQGNLGSEDMKKYVYIPLPPLEEQKRIVAKIEELLPYCNQLMEKY